jgi:hypothetical protein
MLSQIRTGIILKTACIQNQVECQWRTSRMDCCLSTVHHPVAAEILIGARFPCNFLFETVAESHHIILMLPIRRHDIRIVKSAGLFQRRDAAARMRSVLGIKIHSLPLMSASRLSL